MKRFIFILFLLMSCENPQKNEVMDLNHPILLTNLSKNVSTGFYINRENPRIQRVLPAKFYKDKMFIKLPPGNDAGLKGGIAGYTVKVSSRSPLVIDKVDSLIFNLNVKPVGAKFSEQIQKQKQMPLFSKIYVSDKIGQNKLLISKNNQLVNTGKFREMFDRSLLLFYSLELGLMEGEYFIYFSIKGFYKN